MCIAGIHIHIHSARPSEVSTVISGDLVRMPVSSAIGRVGRRGQAPIGGEHVEDRGAEELEAEHLVGQPDRDDPTPPWRRTPRPACRRSAISPTDLISPPMAMEKAAPINGRNGQLEIEDRLPEIEAGFAPALLLSAGDNRVIGVGHAERGADKLVEIGHELLARATSASTTIRRTVLAMARMKTHLLRVR